MIKRSEMNSRGIFQKHLAKRTGSASPMDTLLCALYLAPITDQNKRRSSLIVLSCASGRALPSPSSRNEAVSSPGWN
jgi:hypothetical protein